MHPASNVVAGTSLLQISSDQNHTNHIEMISIDKKGIFLLSQSSSSKQIANSSTLRHRKRQIHKNWANARAAFNAPNTIDQNKWEGELERVAYRSMN